MSSCKHSKTSKVLGHGYYLFGTRKRVRIVFCDVWALKNIYEYKWHMNISSSNNFEYTRAHRKKNQQWKESMFVGNQKKFAHFANIFSANSSERGKYDWWTRLVAYSNNSILIEMKKKTLRNRSERSFELQYINTR